MEHEYAKCGGISSSRVRVCLWVALTQALHFRHLPLAMRRNEWCVVRHWNTLLSSSSGFDLKETAETGEACYFRKPLFGVRHGSVVFGSRSSILHSHPRSHFPGMLQSLGLMPTGHEA